MNCVSVIKLGEGLLAFYCVCRCLWGLSGERVAYGGKHDLIEFFESKINAHIVFLPQPVQFI
jgi:hypothetical protein